MMLLLWDGNQNMNKKKYPFKFGDWVEYGNVAKKVTFEGVREIRSKSLYEKYPAVGCVIGYVRRYEGKCEYIGSEEGSCFYPSKSVLLVQVRRSLTSKIEECFPEELSSRLDMNDKGIALPNECCKKYKWSKEDCEEMRKEAFLMKRDSNGRFMKTSWAERQAREKDIYSYE